MFQFLYKLKSIIPTYSSYKSLNWIAIFSQAIKHNFSVFQQYKPNYTIIPVLKSNAYEHGLKQIAKICNTIDNCKIIAVDSFPEYQIIHRHTSKEILIMGETLASNCILFDTQRTHFAVWTKACIDVLGKQNKHCKLHIFVNTGMNREGVQLDKLDDLINLIKQYPTLEIVGLMSHLACADDPSHKCNTMQVDNFYKAYQTLQAYGIKLQYIHLEASAGMINTIDRYGICNTGRLGIGLYGLDPLYNGTLSAFGDRLQPALEIFSTITSIQKVGAQDGIGYNQTRHPEKGGYIATFPFGYREGLDRTISNKGRKVLIGNTYYELVGKVSMNYATCFVDESVKIGDTVKIISSDIDDLNNIYAYYDTINRIPYEIVKLDDKVKRVII